MKNTNFRTAFLAATAAVLLIPAANAGGLGGALGGAVGGTMGGTLGGSFGNSMGTIGGGGSADGFGQGRLGAPDLGRPIGRVRDTGDRVTEHGKAATGKVRDRASDAKSSALSRSRAGLRPSRKASSVRLNMS